MDRLSHALKYKSQSFCDKKTKVIYILKCDKFYKIGYASNLKKRLIDYSVHNPFSVRVISSIECDKPKDFETWVYESFNECIHRGEWYLFNDMDLMRIQVKWFGY